MATSGTFTTSAGYTTEVGNTFKLKFSWEETSQSIADNKTTIKWTITGETGSSTYVKAQNITLKIDGVVVFEHLKATDGQINLYNGTVVGSGTHTFNHNTDGSKSFTAYLEGGLYVWEPNCSGTKSFTLDTIPRASSIAATAANIGSQTTITVSKAKSSFTHTITYVFGNLSGTIATKSSSTSIKWTVPTTFYGQIPSAKTGTCTLTCETFNGSTSLGKKNVKFTVTAAQSLCKPLLASTAVDTNETTIALTGDSSKIIKYYSNVKTQVNATARNSATIKSRSTKHNGKTTTTDISNFTAVSANTFDFSATDSRGYTTTSTKTLTMINYIHLTCNFEADMPTTDGVMTFKVSGNFFNGSFGAKTNTLTLQYRYKEDGGTWGSWTTLTATKSGNTYSVDTTITGLDYQKTYVFMATAADLLETKNSTEVKVSTLPVFDWGENDFNFNVPVSIQGRTLPAFITGYSNIEFAASSTTTKLTNFGVEFASAPIVLIQQPFQGNPIYYFRSDITKTGFTARFNNTGTSSGNRDFAWLAIGTLA